MRKNFAIVGGLAALALVISLGGVLAPRHATAGDGKCPMSTASAAKTSGGSSCCATGQKASLEGAHCTRTAGLSHANCCPFDKAAFQTAAPGTRYEFAMSNNGATLTISAASARYVTAVQQMASADFDKMKTQLAAEKTACPTGASMSGSTMSRACPHSAGAVTKAGLTTTSGGASCCAGDKAKMTEKTGAACPMHAGMSSASVITTAGTMHDDGGLCEEFLKGMCSSDARFEKTANGARISWTSVKPEIVKSVQMAADHMKNCMTTTGL